LVERKKRNLAKEKATFFFDKKEKATFFVDKRLNHYKLTHKVEVLGFEP